MYNIIKQNIINGGFKLTDIQYKAKKLYIMGDITETQLDELMSLATNSANIDGERPEQAVILRTLYEMYLGLERRLKTLENGGESDEGSESTYDVWKPWDGLSKDYAYGKIVEHNGKLWKSTYQGQNVWEPGTHGIDERYWIEYNPETI